MARYHLLRSLALEVLDTYLTQGIMVAALSTVSIMSLQVQPDNVEESCLGIG